MDGRGGGAVVGATTPPARCYTCQVSNRCRNAAMAWRSTLADGRNVWSGHPVVIPVEANHSISRKNGAPTGTSVNVAVAGGVNAGSPANRYKNAAIACRSTVAIGRNGPSGHPVVIPVDASHSISRKNGELVGTSVNDGVAGGVKSGE